ncbi:hypothetical protein GCM10010358_77230 [Streptomyces minutiscleroticus]|uniref:Uncharacterized protein n=1 Tax=Streptomyces minutiscleroticus TaxID=68238 RepID=A0A918P213_9ACTN|nr:hypothetical protein GCM10010358_77230 [Streptomyces minutiscleroticus]
MIIKLPTQRMTSASQGDLAVWAGGGAGVDMRAIPSRGSENQGDERPGGAPKGRPLPWGTTCYSPHHV